MPKHQMILKNNGTVFRLKNLKYNIERKGVANSNAADHVIAVEELTKTHDFVQNVQHMKGINHPVVTLYNEQQMTDIKRFCCRDKGSVLGIDKTYNLGEFHVTPTVYKDLSVVAALNNRPSNMFWTHIYSHQLNAQSILSVSSPNSRQF